MAVNLSPGVSVTEIDLSTTVTQASSSTGGIVIDSNWGPVESITITTSEDDLVNYFDAPTNDNYVDFFSAASFLAYTNDLRVVRAANSNTFNAVANSEASDGIQVKTDTEYEYRYLHSDNDNKIGAFIARYPGTKGNGLTIEIFDSANTEAFDDWDYKGYFSTPPGTSDYVFKKSGSNDEFHMVVIDTLGKFSGTKGSVLSTYGYLSKASDAIDDQGDSIYWKNVILRKDDYVYGVASPDYANTATTWGQTASGTTFARIDGDTMSFTLTNGTYVKAGDSDYINGYNLFNDIDNVDISLVLTSDRSITVKQHIIDNVCTEVSSEKGTNGRAICFISPPKDAVLFNNGNEVDDIQKDLNTLARYTSYAVRDDNWKYMYDKYNKTYRWIPCSSDVAGLCAQTDRIRDAWWSPAGLNRGKIKNAVKLAWNANKTQRDILYPLGVNSIISMVGEGILLFGDKTATQKPSAFSRINVRRLFIVLEKSIANSAKYSLFEFNDEQTRSAFVATVTPFMRNVKARRGVQDFRVVCDESNNTGYVIDNNQFVGDIYIKPNRSINWINLNFICVGSSVTFDEAVGMV